MSDIKYVAFDLHLSSISTAVLDAGGKIVTQSVIRTQAPAIRDFLRSISGQLHLTFEEGTLAQWLFDLTRPLVSHILVCDPRENHSLRKGNKSDYLDALGLARLLRAGLLKPVFHTSSSTITLKHLAHNYDSITSDTTRVMNRLKALFRSQALDCAGRDVYYSRNRSQWLDKLREPGLRLRAEFLYNQLDHLRPLRRQAKKSMLTEAQRHTAFNLLTKVPALGPIRAAEIIAAVGSPHRFRTKRQFWAYCGLAVITSSSADYHFAGDTPVRRMKSTQTRGLNSNFNPRLKRVFKSAVLQSLKDESFNKIYSTLIAKGRRPEMARLTVARKLAAVTLAVWKKGEDFDSSKLTRSA